MESIPIGIFWSVAIWCLFRPRQALIYLFFASMPFGSFAAIPPSLTGGLTLTPAPIVAMLMIARQLGTMHGLSTAVDTALKHSGMLLLFVFWIISGIVTIFMPRFFAGEVEVVNVGLAQIMPLAPTPQNFSQFVYISLSVLTVFIFSSILRDQYMRRHALTALFLGAALTVFTGFLDFVAQYLPLQSILELFRTASYALLTDVEILDGKRVVGLMPEASSFGGLSLSFLVSLYFFRRALPSGKLRDRVAPALMLLLLLLVWLSTSSAAYLGLGFFAAVAFADWCWRLLASGRNPYLRRGLSSEFWFGAIALWTLLLIVVAIPKILDPIVEMFDVMVLQKTGSSSFEERSMWTQVSWDALWATHGLGVGMGGTRASNFAVALASNSGLLGVVLYFSFVLQVFLFRRITPNNHVGGAVLSAIRWSYLPPFFASLTTGTTPDFGLFNAFLYGLAVAITYKGAHLEVRCASVTQALRSSIGKPSQLAMKRNARVD